MPPALPRRLELALPHLAAFLLWALALAAAAWFSASWYWRLRAPQTVALPPATLTDPVIAARSVGARHLFGETPPNVATAKPASRFTLLGVAAHSGRSPGFAIIQEDGKPALGFVQGENISDGTKLLAIHATSVEIERNGGREVLTLADPSNAHAAPSSALPIQNRFAPQQTQPTQTSAVAQDLPPQTSMTPQASPQPPATTQATNDNQSNQ